MDNKCCLPILPNQHGVLGLLKRMSTTEIIDQIKTLPLEDRKAVFKALSEELEEECDTRLFDERSNEPDGRKLSEILGDLKSAT